MSLLRTIARRAVRGSIRYGVITAVDGVNSYTVQVPGHVDQQGDDVPMTGIRSLSNKSHAVGERVIVAWINSHKPRYGAMWCILDAAGQTTTTSAVLDAWPLFGYGNARTRGRLSNTPQSWSVDGGWAIAHELSSGGAVMTTSAFLHTYNTGDHKLRAWSLSGASPLWATDIGYSGGGVVVGSIYNGAWIGWASGKITSVDAVSGAINWQRAESQAYAFCYDSTDTGYYLNGTTVKSFNSTTGTVGWTRNVASTLGSGGVPGSDDELQAALILLPSLSTVLLRFNLGMSANSYVVGINTNDGTIRWSTGLDNSYSNVSQGGSWLALGNTVITGSSHNNGGPGPFGSELVAVDASTGSISWRLTTDDYLGFGNVSAAASDASWALFAGTFPDPSTSNLGMVAVNASGSALWTALDSTRRNYNAVVFAGTSALALSDTTSPSDRLIIDEYGDASSTATASHAVTGVRSDWQGLEPMIYDGKLYFQERTTGYLGRVV